MNLEQKTRTVIIIIIENHSRPKKMKRHLLFTTGLRSLTTPEKNLNMMEITTSRDQVVEEELSDQEEVRENVFFKGC